MSKLRPPVQCHVDDPIGRALKRGPDAALRAIRDAERVKGEKAAKAESPLEASFLELWMESGGRQPWREYEFAKKSTGRRWRFDFCWPGDKVGVELSGVADHASIKGFRRDAAKYNAAVLLGWRVLTYTATDLKERPDAVVEEVKSLLEHASP